MAYVVLARKYRPATFADVVGQRGIAATLRNAVATGRVGHAYLFCGPRGVGKTSLARIFSKAINCPNTKDGEPCGACPICLDVAVGKDLDVYEIDGASNNKVDDARALREGLGYAPTHSPYRIIYIDEVHSLSKDAFNALLKSLEEPPPHVKFIFATTEAQKVPETIRSRCQCFDFAPLSVEEIRGRLAEICEKEAIPVDAEVLLSLARKARGGMRDALSDLDQLVAFGGGKVTAEAWSMAFGLAEEAELEAMLDALAAGDPAGAFDALDAALAHGRDVEGVVDQLADHLRDCMVVALCGPDTPLVTVGGAVRERLKARARKASADAWMSMLGLLEEAAARMKRTDRPRIAAELALMRAGRMAHLIDLAALVEKLSEGAGWPGAAGTVSSGTELPSASGKAGGGLAPSPDAGGHRQPAPSLGEQARLRSAGETPEIARRQDVGSASSDERGGRQDVARGAVTASPPPALPRHVTETPPPARAAATAATPPAVTNGLASRWSAFLDGVRAKAPALGRSMGSARPVGFDGRVLELDVSAVGPLDLHVLTNMLETPEKRQLAESVAAGVFGTGVRLALAAAAPAEGSLWSPPAAPSRPAPAPKPVVLAPSPEAPPAATQGQNLLEHGEVKNWIRALKGKVVRNEW